MTLSQNLKESIAIWVRSSIDRDNHTFSEIEEIISFLRSCNMDKEADEIVNDIETIGLSPKLTLRLRNANLNFN